MIGGIFYALAPLAQRHQVNVVRRYRRRPDNPVLIVVCFGHGGQQAIGVQPVPAYYHRLCFPLLIQVADLHSSA